MKKFTNPMMEIEMFNVENIVTTSGAVNKAVNAVTASEGGVTLDGKELSLDEIITVLF